jgi:hypothetical protein
MAAWSSQSLQLRTANVQGIASEANIGSDGGKSVNGEGH